MTHGNSGSNIKNSDTPSELDHLSNSEIRRRTTGYFSWCLLTLATALLIGLLPAILIFLISYLRIESKESWKMTLAVGLGSWSVSYLLFHQLLRVPWPASFIGDLLPGLRAIGATNLL